MLSCFSQPATSTPIARLAILHGYGDHAGHYFELMQWLADHQISNCVLDFRGHGRSAGKVGYVQRWDDHLTDLTAFLAIDELSTTKSQAPLFLFSHSHGGLVAAAAAMRGSLNAFNGIILSAPFFDLKMPVPFLKRSLAAVASAVHPSMQIRSGVTGPKLTRDQAMIDASRNDPYIRGIATPRWFYETRKAQITTRATAAQFKLPLLMLVPGQDAIADPQTSVDFFNACSSADKTIVHYPEHYHELMRELGREELFQTMLDWTKQRL